MTSGTLSVVAAPDDLGRESVGWLPWSLRAELWADAIDYWTAYMVASGARGRTIDLRRYQLGRLAEDHLNRSPWSLSTRDLTAWLAGHDWSPETRKSFRAALRSFYRWAAESGQTRRNPAAALRTVRTSTPPPRPTPDRVLARALDCATERDRLVILLCAYAGLRCGEVAALRWEHIIGEQLRVHGKGGRVRVVPMHPVLAVELADEHRRRRAGVYGSGYRYRCDCGCVIPGQGGPITPGAVGRIASRALGPGWSGHTLRHRFGTRACAAGGLLVAQQLLGHSRPETTTRYTELADERLAVAVAAV